MSVSRFHHLSVQQYFHIYLPHKNVFISTARLVLAALAAPQKSIQLLLLGGNIFAELLKYFLAGCELQQCWAIMAGSTWWTCTIMLRNFLCNLSLGQAQTPSRTSWLGSLTATNQFATFVCLFGGDQGIRGEKSLPLREEIFGVVSDWIPLAGD